MEALSISYEQIAPLNQDPFNNPNYTLYHALYGVKGRQEFMEKVRQLCTHKDPEISSKSMRLLEILAKISPMRESMYSLDRILQ